MYICPEVLNCTMHSPYSALKTPSNAVFPFAIAHPDSDNILTRFFGPFCGHLRSQGLT